MTLPLRIGVMQLTMEPLEEILEHARELDRHGFDTIWLAEAYPWWRKHSMEARSSTAISALIARETERLTVGWGIIAPYTRHPIQVAMEARVTQEALGGEGRFRLGFGASKIFMKEIGEGERKPARPLTAIRESLEIVRAILNGEELDFEGREYTARVPALREDAVTPRTCPPLYVAATGPDDAEARRRDRRRAADALDHDAGVRALHGRQRRRRSGRRRDAIRTRSTSAARSSPASTRPTRSWPRRSARDRRHVPGQQVPEHQGLGRHAARPGRDRDDRARPRRRGDGARRRLAAKGAGDGLPPRPLQADRRPTADCIRAIEEYREAGCTHVMLELWGADRHEQIRLFAEEVLPHVRSERRAHLI